MNDKPVVLMPEDVDRLLGKDAQRSNILAAKMIADIVRTTLGPKGMDKMLVSSNGEVIVTNDGATILDEMDIEHPAAKMMVEIAKTQELEVGDGTTTAVMLAGKLLENAEKLLDSKIHPTIITKGYKIANEKVQEILKEISLRISFEDEEVLKQIAITAMTGKGAEGSKEKLSSLVVKALRQISKHTKKINLDDIKIMKFRGGSVENSKIIYGVVLDKEKVSDDMPASVFDPKIVLLDCALEIQNPEIDTRISITSPEQLQDYLSQEQKIIKQMVEKIIHTGAKAVFCQKGIDEYAQYLLSKAGIYACRRVSRSDMERLAKATGAKIVSNLDELGMEELGTAHRVLEVVQEDEKITFVDGCRDPKSVTILLYGGAEHVLDETERAVIDALGDVSAVLKSGLVVAGGGAVEIELAKRLRDFANSLNGRIQLAVLEFASALESIPEALAENAGLDPIDILTELKTRHNSGERNIGLNLLTDNIEDVLQSRIIEPYSVKSQAINSASEVAIMILRIDDVIASKPKQNSTE